MAENEMPGGSRPGPSRLDWAASLISELAGSILNDGAKPTGSPAPRPELHRASWLARFTEALSEHRRLHTEVLHRALREVAPEFGGAIDELDARYESLRRILEAMSEEPEHQGAENGIGMARWLLVELLSHLSKESQSEVSMLRALSADQFLRLPVAFMGLLIPGEADPPKRNECQDVVEVA